MTFQPVLKSQYHASLNTLRQAIDKCPTELWNSPADNFATVSRVAYHALFFTHFYLNQDQSDFTPWPKAREEAQFLGPLPWQGNRLPKTSEPYTREDILEYWTFCDGFIDPAVDKLDLSAPQCGFPWYKMSTLEHQILNIRHLQNHAAALATRLRKGAKVEIPWVAKG